MFLTLRTKTQLNSFWIQEGTLLSTVHLDMLLWKSRQWHITGCDPMHLIQNPTLTLLPFWKESHGVLSATWLPASSFQRNTCWEGRKQYWKTYCPSLHAPTATAASAYRKQQESAFRALLWLSVVQYCSSESKRRWRNSEKEKPDTLQNGKQV